MTPKVSAFCPHAPTDRQAVALVAHRFLPDDEPSEVFYGGAAGGGKSDWLLMGALEHVDVPGYAAIVFRRTYTDLALPGAIMARSKEWLAPYRRSGDVHWNDTDKTWTFPAGSTLSFAYLKTDDDVYRYQSAEFQFVGFDELTQFSEWQYEYLFSRLRRPAEGPVSRVPLRMRAASNPGGLGHGWVKARFPIDSSDKRWKGRRVFVPAKIADNPHLDVPAYRKSLAHLGDTLRQQLEEGDWDVAEGLAFQVSPGTWITDMEIPAGWERFESLDFGVANPTCVLAWAVDYDGNCVIFDSYYRGDTLVSDHAQAIEAKRKVWWFADGESLGSPVCHADPSMWARTGRVNRWGDPATDVTEFQEQGVSGLVQANNKRRPGRVRVTELLKPDLERRFPAWHARAGEHGSPRLFIVRSRCPELAEQVTVAPLLPIDSGKEGAGEIVDPAWESQDGHAVAALRYGAMSRPDGSEEPEPVLEDPRAELLRRVERERDGLEGPSRKRFQYV